MHTDIMEIDAEKLHRMLALHVGFLLFDVRDLADFQKSHIPGSISVPAAEFIKKLPTMVPIKETPIVVYDAEGKTSLQCVTEAGKLGYLNVVNLEGGYLQFLKKKTPEKKTP